MSESEGVLPRSAVFAVASVAIILCFAAAGAPIPLLSSLGAAEGGGRADLAGVAMAYFVGTLGALVVFGRLSDHVGRTPLVIAAIAAAATASALTAVTVDVPVFVAARVLQGVSIGLAASAVSALVVDTAPPQSPWLGATVAAAAAPTGVPIGVLAMSVAIEPGDAAGDAVLVVLCALLLACAVVVLVGAGRGPRRPGALGSLMPRLLSLRSRRTHAVAVFVATGTMWGFGGVHQTFGPTMAADAFDESSALVGGLLFVSLPLGTPLGALAIGRLGPRRSVMVGAVAAALGVTGVWVAVVTGSLPGFVASCLVVGAAQAAVLGGAAGWILARTEPGDRAGALATYAFVSYGSATLVAGLISAAHPWADASAVLSTAALATGVVALVVIGLFRTDAAGQRDPR